MKTLKIFLLFFITIVAGSLSLKAQEKDPAELKKMIESKNFIFKAQTAFPQSGNSRMLTSEYDLTVSGDKVISYLPYFGRAYTAPANSAEGGIKFTSTDFSYEMKQDKKGWQVIINPKDASGVQQLDLDISENGYATLRVNNTNRQGISFYGRIEKRQGK